MIRLLFGAIQGLGAFSAASWFERSIDAIIGVGSVTVAAFMIGLSPRAPAAAKIFFCVLGAIALGEVALEIAYSLGADIIARTLASAVSSAFWLGYFHRSMRVKVTFHAPQKRETALAATDQG